MNIDQIMNPRTPTRDDLKRAFALTLAVSETIREAGTVPAGVLYAGIMDRVDLRGFEAMIQTLKNTGLVEERSNVLRWTGPGIAPSAEVHAR